MPPASAIASKPAAAEDLRDSQQTTCCVVGGGPGGMMLALLLARQRVPVTLLEQHKRGDGGKHPCVSPEVWTGAGGRSCQGAARTGMADEGDSGNAVHVAEPCSGERVARTSGAQHSLACPGIL